MKDNHNKTVFYGHNRIVAHTAHSGCDGMHATYTGSGEEMPA